MNTDWIEDWRKQIGKNEIDLHGIMNTSKNLEVALNYTKCHTEYAAEQQPVLFVYSIRNYNHFSGFRLNDKRFTPYPEEEEYLLMDGFWIYVLDVEDNYEIVNKHKAFQKFNGKKITVVYL